LIIIRELCFHDLFLITSGSFHVFFDFWQKIFKNVRFCPHLSAFVHPINLDFQHLKCYLYVFMNLLNLKIMAIINGPFEFKGSFGNMRCYWDPGTKQWIFGKNGGFDKKQYETLDTLQPQRENASDFSGRSKWASLLYDGLSDLKPLMYIRCWARIMAAAKLIQRQDTDSPKGLRKIEVGKGLQIIAQIDFSELHPFSSVLRENYVINFSEDKKTITLTISDFVTVRDAWWETKYLAARIYLVVAQTADMVYNPENEKWEPVVEGLELLSRKVVSGWMYYNSLSNDVNLSVSLDDPAFSMPGTAVVAAVGIEFALTASDGQPVALPHNGSMAIVKCYNE